MGFLRRSSGRLLLGRRDISFRELGFSLVVVDGCI